MSVAEYSIDTPDPQRGELPNKTLKYSGEFVEDTQPLFNQGRLTVELNGITLLPEYISVTERKARTPKKISDEHRKETEWVEEGDRLMTVTSAGFTVEFHHDHDPTPELLCDYGMGVTCLGFAIIGIHEQWSGHQVQFSDYSLTPNSDGLYEFEVELDRFIRSKDAESPLTNIKWDV